MRFSFNLLEEGESSGEVLAMRIAHPDEPDDSSGRFDNQKSAIEGGTYLMPPLFDPELEFDPELDPLPLPLIDPELEPELEPEFAPLMESLRFWLSLRFELEL
jgi:hypothetical protein